MSRGFPAVSPPGWCAATCLVLGLVAAAAGAEDRSVTIGGEDLFAALESAPGVVVGEVGEAREIDRHAWEASLRVERSLRGTAEKRALLRMTWEERSPARRPRFEDGDRVLVVLEPLPGQSIWKQRFPGPGERSKVRAVAAGGRAFLRQPASAAVETLHHYLQLVPTDRDGPGGAAYLAQLAAGAQEPLALAAVVRLGRFAGLDEKLGPNAGAWLVTGLMRPDASERLEAAILDLIGRHRLSATRPALEIYAAGSGVPPAIVFAALAAVDGELDAERTTRLLSSPAPEYRRVGALHASGPRAASRLEAMLRSDDDASVREAAVGRLVELRGVAAMGPALDALRDPDASVRLAAARALGTLGAASVESLRRAVDQDSPDAARAAVAALEYSGAPGQSALEEIARSHEDRGVRALARVALGGRLDEPHH